MMIRTIYNIIWLQIGKDPVELQSMEYIFKSSIVFNKISKLNHYALSCRSCLHWYVPKLFMSIGNHQRCDVLDLISNSSSILLKLHFTGHTSVIMSLIYRPLTWLVHSWKMVKLSSETQAIYRLFSSAFVFFSGQVFDVYALDMP